MGSLSETFNGPIDLTNTSVLKMEKLRLMHITCEMRTKEVFIPCQALGLLPKFRAYFARLGRNLV
jgi:hypothetical protein